MTFLYTLHVLYKNGTVRGASSQLINTKRITQYRYLTAPLNCVIICDKKCFVLTIEMMQFNYNTSKINLVVKKV